MMKTSLIQALGQPLLRLSEKASSRLGRARRRATAGETLAETLAAVLVATLASLILLGSSGVAANLNARAEATDRALAADQAAVEARTGEGAGMVPSQAVLVADDGSILGSYDVTMYVGDEGKYRSYGKAES